MKWASWHPGVAGPAAGDRRPADPSAYRRPASTTARRRWPSCPPSLRNHTMPTPSRRMRDNVPARRRVLPARWRHAAQCAQLPGRAARRRRRGGRHRRRHRRRTRQRLLRGPPARPPCAAVRAHGFLPVQQRRDRRPPCARGARPGTGGHRRLRRPPRQRHRGSLPRRSARADGQLFPASVLSVHRRRRAQFNRQHASMCRCRPAAAATWCASWCTEHGCRRCTRFRPQMMFISAGFDAHREDDMGGMSAGRSRLCLDHAAGHGGGAGAYARAASSAAWKAATTCRRSAAAWSRT